MPNLIESLRNDFINHPVKISRRKVLKKVVLGITGLVVESVLSGCTSSNQIETKIVIPTNLPTVPSTLTPETFVTSSPVPVKPSPQPSLYPTLDNQPTVIPTKLDVVGEPIRYSGGNEVSTWDPISMTWKKETLEGVKSVEKINGEWLAWPVEKEADRFRPIFKYNPTINKWEKFVPKITTIEIPDGKGGVGVAETLRLEPIDEKLIKRMVIQDIWDPKSKPFVAPFGAIHVLDHDYYYSGSKNIKSRTSAFSAIIRKIIQWPYFGYNPLHPGRKDSIIVVLEAITNAGNSQLLTFKIADQITDSLATKVNQQTGQERGISGMDAIKIFNRPEMIGQQIVFDLWFNLNKGEEGSNKGPELIEAAITQDKLINLKLYQGYDVDINSSRYFPDF